MNPDAAFQEAIQQQAAWKPELLRFAVALVRRAVASGEAMFTTDIVPDDERGDGPGIAGSAVELLKSANVIKPVGFDHHGEWFAKRQKSTRPDRKGAWLAVYQLTSHGMAEAFLQRHGSVTAAPKQMDLIA